MEEFECASLSGDEEGGKPELDKERKEESHVSPELCAVWTGPASCRQPVLLFSAATIQHLPGPLIHPLQGPYHLTFKMSGDSVRIVRTILFTHGFSEVPMSSSHFNVIWTGGVGKPHVIRQLRPHQKINHFPKCSELCRKDKLCENVRRMQHAKGTKHFNIIPTTFILPGDANRFLVTYRKHRGTWIVKPSTLSRGRGIFLINHPNQLPRTGEMVVSHYIENPLCIDGFKFDLRLYVAVTSYDPLRIYLYEDGLTRFATVRYEGSSQQLDNRCMHLTNYSVNKHSMDYVSCSDPNVEDYGNKWSLSGLLRHLQREGINVTELMMRIEDVVIKTILCSEEQIASACKLFMPHRGNCFEMFGFDVLVDDTLRPWVLEVNLSPSLATDAPLDLRIKSNLIADLLSLTGVAVRDPVSGEIPKAAHKGGHSRTRHRHPSGGVSHGGLTSEEAAVVRETKEEYARRGGFVRIFPTEDSWDLYGVKSPKPPIVSLSAVINKRLHSLSEGVVSEIRLHEQPTGLNPVQRTSLYTKKLTWYSKLKPPRSFTATAGTSTTRHRLPSSSKQKGADQAQNVSTSSSAAPSHVTDMVDHVINSVAKLSKFQVRQIFASYLECVQRRLVRETNSLTNIHTSISIEDQSVDVVVKFLKKASANLRAPFFVIVPNHKLPLRERRRMLAKQLAEFVMLYRKETLEVASREDLISSGESIFSSELLKTFLHQASEEDLEGVLGAYAKQSHSSTTVFLNSSTKPDSTTPTSGVPPVNSGSMRTRAAVPKASDSDQMLRKREDSAAVSAVRRQESAPSIQRIDNTTENLPSNSVAPARYVWLNEHAVEGDSLTSALPTYSKDMLGACDLPLNSKVSLEKLTQSLQSFGKVSSTTTQSRGERMRTGSASTRLTPHKRSLSVQSLVSTTSSVDSDMSEMAGHRMRYPSGGSQYSTSSVTSLTRGQPKSATVIISKDKPYVSPYAQSVLRTKEKSKSKTAKNRIIPHPPLHPAGSVESIAHALNRITQRQNARKYAARRPVVSALKAASQSSVVTAQTLSQESTQERESVDYDVIAENSNNSNNREYVTPVPSYGAQVNPSSAISQSTWRNSPFFTPTTQNAQSAVSQITPNLASPWTIHNSTHSSTPHTRQSFEDHPSFSHRTTSNKGHGDKSATTAQRRYGTSASLDLLRRIQLHNKAISHYIEMQRQHQTPLSVNQPSSTPTNPSCLVHYKKQPTPTSLESHDCTSNSAPHFKFVVPHPPSTPKPNFILGGHRGVIRTIPISM